MDVASFGAKKCVVMKAQVSTARPDTGEVESPLYVPGSGEAKRWLEKLIGSVDEEVWDLSGKNLSAAEHVSHLALLVGRGRELMAPRLHTLVIKDCQLSAEGTVLLAGSIVSNPTLLRVE
jgi:hypothetical protein